MMGPQDTFPPHAIINRKLAEVVGTSPRVPPWYDAWMLLGPLTSSEERLKVYQAVRNAGSLPEEAGFYLVSWQVDAITCERAEIELHAMEDRLEELETETEEEDGIESGAGKSPSEYDKLLNEYHGARDALFARTLREFGEAKMAELFQGDREQFNEIDEAGRQYFHGPFVPDWLEELVDAVAGCIEVDDPLGPLGYRWHAEDDNFWEIDLYPTPIELVGGAVDGAVVDPGYSLDLEAFRSVFEQIDAFSWNTHGFHGSEPPFVSVEGIYQEREIVLRVLSAAPEGEEPGMKFQVTR